MESSILEFKSYLAQEGRKQTTICRHANILRLLYSRNVSLTRNSIDTYLYGLKESGKRGAYLNSILNTVTLYAKFAGIDELSSHKRFKVEPFVKATMSDEEIEAFLSLPPKCKGNKFASCYRIWTLFFSICAYTGMRPGEVAHLTINDIDFGLGTITILESKTGHPRLVPIPPNLIEPLKSYCGALQTTYLFPSAKGGNHNGTGKVVDSVDWWYNFNQRIKRLGLKRTNLSPYSLRHSMITSLLREDVNIHKIAKLVGHRVEQTATYEHLVVKDIQEALKRHPLIRRATDPRAILLALMETFSKLFERDDRFEKSIEDHGNEVVIRVKIKKS